MTYAEFIKIDSNIYKTSIQYKIRYDEKTFVKHDNKVTGRLFITSKTADQPAREIEVILVAEYK